MKTQVRFIVAGDVKSSSEIVLGCCCSQGDVDILRAPCSVSFCTQIAHLMSIFCPFPLSHIILPHRKAQQSTPGECEVSQAPCDFSWFFMSPCFFIFNWFIDTKLFFLLPINTSVLAVLTSISSEHHTTFLKIVHSELLPRTLHGDTSNTLHYSDRLDSERV
jgi:hypothetical protein